MSSTISRSGPSAAPSSSTRRTMRRGSSVPTQVPCPADGPGGHCQVSSCMTWTCHPASSAACATVRSVVDRPVPGEPVTSSGPRPGCHSSASVRWVSGRSTRPRTRARVGSGGPPPAVVSIAVPTTVPGPGPGRAPGSPGPPTRVSSASAAQHAGNGGRQSGVGRLSPARAIRSVTMSATSSSVGRPRGAAVGGHGGAQVGPRVLGGRAAHAVCNGSGGWSARRSTARPGRSAGIAAASAVPTTSSESDVSVTRRHSLTPTLARTWASSAPAGRWVASTRWIPSERPCEASRTSAGRTSGRSSRSARSSSTTTSRRGGAGPAARRDSRSPTPAAASRLSRRRSSARTPAKALAAACGSRSVTVPTTCGSRWHAPRPAPPLKSTRTSASRSGP